MHVVVEVSPTSHLIPNVLPRGHTREDYDFEYADGTWGPIRVPELFSLHAGTVERLTYDSVWCKRHGWEREIAPTAWITTYDNRGFKPDEYAWRCPVCGVIRRSPSYRDVPDAVKALWSHITMKHDGIVPYRKAKWESDDDADQREFIR